MNQQNDIESCRRLLSEIADLCDHACLTGSLSSGTSRVALRYNTILHRLVQAGDVPEGLFEQLPDGVDYGEIGVEARMLASYFENDRKQKRRDRDGRDGNILIRLAPFVRQEELGMLIREQRGAGNQLDMDTLTQLAPFLGQDVMSELLREHLKGQADPVPPVAPAAPVAPVTPSSYALQVVDEPKKSLNELLDILKSQYLSDEERDSIVEKIRALSG